LPASGGRGKLIKITYRLANISLDFSIIGRQLICLNFRAEQNTSNAKNLIKIEQTNKHSAGS